MNNRHFASVQENALGDFKSTIEEMRRNLYKQRNKDVVAAAVTMPTQ